MRTTITKLCQELAIEPLEIACLGKIGKNSIYYLLISPTIALTSWQKLRTAFPQNHLYPVIFHTWLLDVANSNEPLSLVLEDCISTSDNSTIIKQARQFDCEALFTASEINNSHMLRNKWQKSSYTNNHITLTHLAQRLLILLLPVKEPWQAAAFIREVTYFNPLNPIDALTNSALAYRWASNWGAELIAVADTTVEFLVANRPVNRDQALALAWEHIAYSPQSLSLSSSYQIGRKFEYIEDLADSLMRSSVWWFYWE